MQIQTTAGAVKQAVPLTKVSKSAVASDNNKREEAGKTVVLLISKSSNRSSSLRAEVDQDELAAKFEIYNSISSGANQMVPFEVSYTRLRLSYLIVFRLIL